MGYSEDPEDSIKKLKKQLKEIEEAQVTEQIIHQELKDIGHSFSCQTDDEGFYSGMLAESALRARKLSNYSNRLEGIIGRLSAFIGQPTSRVYDWQLKEWIEVSD